jgi:P4 family phage/plasmid primase-like protien
MNSRTTSFLKQHYVDGGTFYTHGSMIQPLGRFQITRSYIEDFWEIYQDEIFNNPNLILGIQEKPINNTPVLADIDIKIKEDKLPDDIDLRHHLYNEEQVKQVIQIYQSTLRKIVDGCSDIHLICCLLEKPIYTKIQNGIKFYKNGFHLHFPYIFLRQEDQINHLFPRIIDELKKSHVFKNLGYEDSSLTMDDCTAKANWLIYGSRKDERSSPYTLSSIYSSTLTKLTVAEAFKNYLLYDVNEDLIDIHGKEMYYLPRIFSITPFGRKVQELKYGLPNSFKMIPMNNFNNNNNNSKNNKKPATTVAVQEALKISRELIEILDPKRYQDYKEWMDIGWTLFSIGDGSDEALEIWMDFSAKDEDKYDEAKCIQEWSKMVKKNKSLGTLKYYASIDSPKEYEDFKKKQSEKHLKNSLEGSHHDIAKLMFEEYGTEFVCSSIASKTWFQFRNHKWEEIEEGIFLREKISDQIVEKYKKMGGMLFADSDDAIDKKYQDNIKKTAKIVQQLKTSSFKTQIMRECCEVFYDKNFKHVLDNNPYLIAFKNGVYDLKDNVFRNGKPDDFLSKAMPIEYNEYPDTDERVSLVFDFLEKVFPDKSVRQYFLDQASDVFVGGNHQKVIIFWTGEGDNGKSVTQNIFEKMFGELAIKFSTTLVTGKKTANGSANPELARAGGGVRWGVLEEPDGDEQLNIGYLKSLSGNDSFFARDLFEKGKATREITPFFKLVFICNKLPPMKSHADKATWNRIRVIPFESTFVKPGEPCPETFEEQLLQKRFPMDTEFSKKIPSLLEPFAYILLEHRKKLKHRVEPEKVRIATEMYRKQNDIYRQYIDENISKTNAANSYLSLSDLYLHFKDWFRDGFPGHQLPVKNDVKEHFIKLWGEPTNFKWCGYKFKDDRELQEEGNAIILNDHDLLG